VQLEIAQHVELRASSNHKRWGGAWCRSLLADAREQTDARRPPDPWEPHVLETISRQHDTPGDECSCLGVRG
jgi:hypothetical protein